MKHAPPSCPPSCTRPESVREIGAGKTQARRNATKAFGARRRTATCFSFPAWAHQPYSLSHGRLGRGQLDRGQLDRATRARSTGPQTARALPTGLRTTRPRGHFVAVGAINSANRNETNIYKGVCYFETPENCEVIRPGRPANRR